MKQLLVYYYRVVYADDGHFTRPGDGDEDSAEEEVEGVEEVEHAGDGDGDRDGDGDEYEGYAEAAEEKDRDRDECGDNDQEDGEDKSGVQGRGPVPKYVIEPSRLQRQAIAAAIHAIRAGDNAAAQHAVRQLYLTFICHTVGSLPFRSPVLSFCAMLSRRAHRGRGKRQRQRRWHRWWQRWRHRRRHRQKGHRPMDGARQLQ